MDNLEQLAASARQAITNAADVAALDEVRVHFLGKKGALTELLKGLGQLPPEQRPAAGAEINRVKDLLQNEIQTRKAELENRMIEAQRRAQAPFESELRAIVLALDALKQAGMAERLSSGEAPSFAPQPPPTPSRRGRRGRTTRDMILMTVRDNGPGLDLSESVREGIGLRNTRERLARLYGERQSCSIQNANDGGAVVSLRFPFSLSS